MTYILPLYTIFVLGLVAAGLIHRRYQKAWSAGLVAAVALAALLAAWQPGAAQFARTLEDRYPDQPVLDREVDVIVVFSAGVELPTSETPYLTVEEGSFYRTRHGWYLHQELGKPLITSGGPVIRGSDQTVGIAMRQLLLDWGVPPDQVIAENRAMNTHDNAVYSAEICRERGWRKVMVVTEAYHMPRSAACFRKLGFEVVEGPANFRSRRTRWATAEWVPNPNGLLVTDQVLREWLAMAAYWWRGWI